MAKPSDKGDMHAPENGRAWAADPCSDADDAPRCLVVMYHYVHDTEPLTCEGVRGLTSRAFREQLDSLCRAAEPISWPTLYAWTHGNATLPKRCFLVTFDDGLVDHAKTVLPILQRRGIRGTFFIPGAVLSTERMLSAHAIHVLLSTLGIERFEQALRRRLEDHRAQCGDPDWASAVDESAAQVMYHYEPPDRARLKYLLTAVLPIPLRDAVVAGLFEEYVGSLKRWARDWYLGWDDVAQLESLGHTIGGHGYAHEPYLRLTAAECRNDLHQCAAVLRGGLGMDIRPFSYPYGSFNDETRTACRAAGFAHAFTTERAWVARGVDPLCVPRFDTIHVDAVVSEGHPCQPT